MAIPRPLTNWEKWAIVLLALMTILFFLAYQEASKERKELKKEYKQYKADAENRIDVLRQKRRALEEKYEKLNQSYRELNNTLTSLKGQLEPTIEKIEVYQEEINESMFWFRKNSILKEEEEQKIATNYLGMNDNCYRMLGGTCYIKTGCVELINSEYLDIEYLNDTEVTGKEDKLQSLNEFLENEGGDCEDYSLFYKAELNYLLEGQCKNDSLEIVIEAWNSSQTGKYWLDYEHEWYFDDAKGIRLKEGYTKPNVICGKMYDPQIGNISGHCVIAFTNKKITQKEDIENLKQAPMVEPQDGKYLGLISNRSSGVYILSENNYEEPPQSYIYSVITDNDMFLFSFEYGKWLSYSSFFNELKEKKEKLLELKK